MIKRRIVLMGAVLACLAFVTVACTAPLPNLTTPAPATAVLIAKSEPPTTAPPAPTVQPPPTPDKVKTAQAEAAQAGAPAAPITQTPTPDKAKTAQAEAAAAGAPQFTATVRPTPQKVKTAQAEAAAATPDKVKTAQAEARSSGAPLPPPKPGVSTLRDEIFLAGAPSFALVNRCPMPENLPPGERAATWTSALDSGLLCLFGFGDNETVRYEVQDAAGEVVESSEGAPDNLDGDALPSVKVIIGIGDKAPGDWTVAASGPSGELTASFQVQATTQEGKPAVILAMGPTLTPFALDQSIPIAAYGLGNATAPLLGVYAVTSQTKQGQNLKLHEAAVLEADAGAAFVTLTLDPTYQPSAYCLVLQLASNYQPTAELSTQGATRCFEVQ